MKKFVCILLTAIFCLCAWAEDYNVKSLDVNVEVGKNAVLSVKEDYVFNFKDYHHGVYREIPYSYDNAHAVISNVQCSEVFTSSKDEGVLELKIGSEKNRLIGDWPLTISYLYDMGQDMNEGYDEFYYNIVSDAEIDYENVSFTVIIPGTVDPDKIWVSAGRKYSTERGTYSSQFVNGKTVITGNLSYLEEDQSLTVCVQMEDGWYVGARQPWDYRSLWKTLNIVISIAVVMLASLAWNFCGRDNIPIISAKFNPPEKFSPMVVGFLADGVVDDKDVTSMLYYWADKGYIQINEPKKNKFTFTKLKDIGIEEPVFEQNLFDSFFRGMDKNSTVYMTDLQRTNFFESMNLVKAKVARFFTKEKKLKETKSLLFAVLFFVLSFVPFATLGLSVGCYEFASDMVFSLVPISMIGVTLETILFWNLFRKWYIRKTNLPMVLFCLIPFFFTFFLSLATCKEVPGVCVSVFSSFITVFFVSIMSRRTEYGDKVLEETLGYREFIEKVSLGELTTMIGEDPMYYYHNLSYAIVLGLEKTWAKKFESITVQNPVWYNGRGNLNPYFYALMASRMTERIKTDAVPQASKSNSHIGGGFSGGFAGGGFGGGSVHAW